MRQLTLVVCEKSGKMVSEFVRMAHRLRTFVRKCLLAISATSLTARHAIACRRTDSFKPCVTPGIVGLAVREVPLGDLSAWLD